MEVNETVTEPVDLKIKIDLSDTEYTLDDNTAYDISYKKITINTFKSLFPRYKGWLGPGILTRSKSKQAASEKLNFWYHFKGRKSANISQFQIQLLTVKEDFLNFFFTYYLYIRDQ